jgi:hypothetical protein
LPAELFADHNASQSTLLAGTDIQSTPRRQADKLNRNCRHNAQQNDDHHQLDKGESARPAHQKFAL